MKRMAMLLCAMFLTGICIGCGRMDITPYTDIPVTEEPTTEPRPERIVEVAIYEHTAVFPCQLQDLGEGFTLKSPLYLENEQQTLCSLYYQDTYIGLVQVVGDRTDEDNPDDAEIVHFSIRFPKENLFTVTTIGTVGYDTYDTYIERLGSSSDKKENSLIYYYPDYHNGSVMFYIKFDEETRLPLDMSLMYFDKSE